MSKPSARLTLSEIWIYPVKSLAGVRVHEANAGEKGLNFDRHWMIVDENGVCVTQRTNALMALVDVSLQTNSLYLSSGSDVLKGVMVPFEPDDPHLISVRVWNDTMLARTVSPEADVWLSNKLQKNVRIVELTELSERYVEAKYTDAPTRLSLADDFPYLMTSRASLDDLNDRLEHSVQMARFRPNFVVTGSYAFEEDGWALIKIGDLEFGVPKSCDRCILINVDPFTADKGKEPLKTLATYRKTDRRIYFGRNLTASQHGLINEGDEITVLETVPREIAARKK